MSRVAEIISSKIRSNITNNVALVSPEFESFFKDIKGKKVIEIQGGMGEHAEHVASLGNTVSLLEEIRLFFVYRRQVWPDSNVIEMNIHPAGIKYTGKPISDIAIIHSSEFEELAIRIAKSSFNTETKEYKVYEEKSVSSPEGSSKVAQVTDDSGTDKAAQ